MSSIFEDLKDFLSEVESFLSVVLKTASLPKHVINEKEDLLKRIKSLKDGYPQLQSGGKAGKPAEPSSADTSCRPGSEIYDDIEPQQAGGNGSYGASVKSPSLSGSEASMSQNAPVQQQAASISVAEVMDGASLSGVLVKKLHGAKKDIKTMFMMAVTAGKKYCIANGGVLYIFDKQSSKKQSESIILKGYEVSVSNEPPTKKEFYFDMVGPGQKSYMFAASSVDEMDKWIAALNEESLKSPNLRVSVVADLEPDEEDYEDADEVVTRPAPVGLINKKIPVFPVVGNSSGPPAVRPHPAPSKGARAPSFLDDDGELYDDIVTSDNLNGNDDSQEVYDDAQSKTAADDDDDLVYECYDDVKADMLKAAAVQNPTSPPLPPVKSPAVNTGAPLPARQSDVKAVRRVIPPMPVDEPVVAAKGDAGSVDDYPNMYYGKWDCEAEDANEIAFKYGDIITVLNRDYGKFGWWVGKLNGAIGLVPCGYLAPAYELVSG